jgi:hypothetical protein
MDFARRIVPFWQAELGSELLGAYLIGSLAHGGFSRRYSDIDMALVAEAGLSPQALDRVRRQAPTSATQTRTRFGTFARTAPERAQTSAQKSLRALHRMATRCSSSGPRLRFAHICGN